MRALSTILCILALAHPAGAQVFGAPSRYDGASWWVSAESGSTRAVNMSDAASGGNWGLRQSTPTRVSLDYGRRSRAIGLAYSQATVPVSFSSTSCGQCRSQVTAQQAMLHYRIVSPMFGVALRSVTELSAGATRWSAFRGLDGIQLTAPIEPNIDFTYGISFGAALAVGDRLEITGSYDSSQLRHEALNTTSKRSFSNAPVRLTTLRFGARLRLGK